MSIRELDIRMKKALKQHKDTLTFGQPQKYCKVQSDIKSLLGRLDDPVKLRQNGYTNESQKRNYKNELYQESFQNKMGLVMKPTAEQLMIGDFIREKKSRVNSYVGEKLRGKTASRLKPNTSDSSLIYTKEKKLEEEALTLHRRHTSKLASDSQSDLINESKRPKKYN